MPKEPSSHNIHRVRCQTDVGQHQDTTTPAAFLFLGLEIQPRESKLVRGTRPRPPVFFLGKPAQRSRRATAAPCHHPESRPTDTVFGLDDRNAVLPRWPPSNDRFAGRFGEHTSRRVLKPSKPRFPEKDQASTTLLNHLPFGKLWGRPLFVPETWSKSRTFANRASARTGRSHRDPHCPGQAHKGLETVREEPRSLPPDTLLSHPRPSSEIVPFQ